MPLSAIFQLYHGESYMILYLKNSNNKKVLGVHTSFIVH